MLRRKAMGFESLPACKAKNLFFFSITCIPNIFFMKPPLVELFCLSIYINAST